jgi:hypothetical protein
MRNITMKAAGPPTGMKSGDLEPKQYNRPEHSGDEGKNPLIGLVRALARHAAASDHAALASNGVTYGKNGTMEAQF